MPLRQPDNLRSVAFTFLSKPRTQRDEILMALGVNPIQNPDDAMREITRRGLLEQFVAAVGKSSS
jgi:hypothetical protein